MTWMKGGSIQSFIVSLLCKFAIVPDPMLDFAARLSLVSLSYTTWMVEICHGRNHCHIRSSMFKNISGRLWSRGQKTCLTADNTVSHLGMHGHAEGHVKMDVLQKHLQHAAAEETGSVDERLLCVR